MRQQINLLVLPQGLDVSILFYTISELIFLSIEIVLVMDDIVFPLSPCGNGIDFSDLTCNFSSICKSGNDEIISPEESEQSNGGQNCCEDSQKESSLSLEECINCVNRPTRKDHYKKILSQIIS